MYGTSCLGASRTRALTNGSLAHKVIYIHSHNPNHAQKNVKSHSNILSNEVKSRNFGNFLLPGPPIFDFFGLFIVILKVNYERNRMTFISSKSTV